MTSIAFKNRGCEECWKIDEQNNQVQFEVALAVEKRFSERETIVNKINVGLQLRSSRRLLIINFFITFLIVRELVLIKVILK